MHAHFYVMLYYYEGVKEFHLFYLYDISNNDAGLITSTKHKVQNGKKWAYLCVDKKKIKIEVLKIEPAMM